MGKAKTAETTQSKETAPGACLLKPLHIETSQGKLSLSPWVLLAANLLFTLLVFSVYRRLHFDGDLYWHVTEAELLPQVTLGHGRPMQSLVCWVLNCLGYDYVADQAMGNLLLMGSLGVCATMLSLRFLRSIPEADIWKLLGVDAAALMVYCNVFIAEWLVHPTSAVPFALAFSTMTLAVLLITGKPSFFLAAAAFCLLAMADNTYQVFFEFFVILALPLLFLDEGRGVNKRLIGRSAAVLAVAALSAASNLALTRLLRPLVRPEAWSLIGDTGNRTGAFGLMLIMNNLRLAAGAQKEFMVDAFGLLPKYLLLGVVAALLTLLVFAAVAGKRCRRGALPYLAAVLAGCYLVLFVPHLISTAPAILARTLMALFAFLAVLALMIFALGKGGRIVKTAALLMTLFLGYNCYTIQQLSANILVFNALDRYEITLLGQAIDAYETESGQAVTKIAVCTDTDPAVYSDYMPKADNPAFQRALAMPWADVDAVNYFTGRQLTEIEMPQEVYQANFAGRNWDVIDPSEQMVFQGDTVYLSVY